MQNEINVLSLPPVHFFLRFSDSDEMTINAFECNSIIYSCTLLYVCIKFLVATSKNRLGTLKQPKWDSQNEETALNRQGQLKWFIHIQYW